MDRLYGRRSEQFLADPDQLPLEFGDDVAAAAEALAEAVLEAEQTIEEVATRRKAKRRRPRLGQRKVPRTLAALREDRRSARGARKTGKIFIGYDEVETLELERARLRVRVTKYAKYADPQQPQAGVASPEQTHRPGRREPL